MRRNQEEVADEDEENEKKDEEEDEEQEEKYRKKTGGCGFGANRPISSQLTVRPLSSRIPMTCREPVNTKAIKETR